MLGRKAAVASSHYPSRREVLEMRGFIFAVAISILSIFALAGCEELEEEPVTVIGSDVYSDLTLEEIKKLTEPTIPSEPEPCPSLGSFEPSERLQNEIGYKQLVTKLAVWDSYDNQVITVLDDARIIKRADGTEFVAEVVVEFKSANSDGEIVDGIAMIDLKETEEGNCVPYITPVKYEQGGWVDCEGCCRPGLRFCENFGVYVGIEKEVNALQQRLCDAGYSEHCGVVQ